ncbi:MAG: hypothetical protein Ta2B_15190 [Termitinemataceae bacterium]|nr:MAG: hypothetical protein Ta2B_15190 [Termitinemataceae bacterium]
MPIKHKFNLKPLPMQQTETLGERIAIIRKQRGLTQVDLARLIGIEQALVSHYECNRLHMDDEMIIRFAVALNISTDELLGLKKANIPEISLRLMKRVAIIDSFPETTKKYIIKMIDDSIKANSMNQAASL